jgi:ATP-dependent RNA helicase SUPV3L1/SUV3
MSDHHATAATLAQLDQLTQGAFTSPTSGERGARVRAWLATEPSLDLIQQVFQALNVKDKGAAKPLREKLDELKRERGQEAIASEWAEKAQHLLALPRLNIADAMAWQRDAAKAGAALSKEPLAALKTSLSERIKQIEDLQHRAQVQRESAVLLVQRTELLSTKSWQEAQAASEALNHDTATWQSLTEALVSHPDWVCVDAKFAPQIENAKVQLLAVGDAFRAALAQAVLASTDPSAALPAVPVWAEELKALHALNAPVTEGAVTPGGKKLKNNKAAPIDPEVQAKVQAEIKELLGKLETELALGHSKIIPKIAAELRQHLKAHGRLVGEELENSAHTLLSQAGELEDWQRWRADQLREDLVAKAEALLAKPLAGRKQQEQLRSLREQWKLSDQGGAANHALWKRFDHACTEAHKVVEEWLEKVREQEGAHMAQRQALIDELKAFAQIHAADLKALNRGLHDFSERWRNAGHVSEKHFEALQSAWKESFKAAQAPLNAAQKENLAQRHALIEQATAVGSAASLDLAAVRRLQQQWQQLAVSVPLERRQEQKLWDAFRKPIDEAFQRKTAEREAAAAAISAYDQAVLDAVKALEAANASGNAAEIRKAISALEAASRGEKPVQMPTPAAEAAPSSEAATEVAPPATATTSAAAEASAETSTDSAPVTSVEPAPSEAASETETTTQASPEPVPEVKAAPKIIKAMRGDDRPGMKKSEPAPQGRGFDKRPGQAGARGGRDAAPGQRRDPAAQPGADTRTGAGARPGASRFDDQRAGGGRRDERSNSGQWGAEHRAERGPRLSDMAYRAQRDALEKAQQQLKKLSSQAHGEVLGQLFTAWQSRQADLVPEAKALHAKMPAATRTMWQKAIASPSATDTAALLLRLEIAANAPTPAEHLSDRKMMQLQLLTRRHEASPSETWEKDVAQVLSGSYQEDQAKRLQTVLRGMLRS